MPITPAHITAGASAVSALGSLFGGSSGSSPREYPRRTVAQMDQNLELQKKAFYSPIQTTVADANKAGIHPLYALGSSANYSPVGVIPGQSNTGSHRKSKIERAGQIVGDAAMAYAQIQSLNAQSSRDEAAANLANSQAAQLDGVANSSGAGRVDAVKNVPSEVISHQKSDPATQAGTHPGRREVATGNNRWGEVLKRKMHMATEEEWSVLFDVENILRKSVIHPSQRALDKIFDAMIYLKHGDPTRTPKRPTTRRQRRQYRNY